MVCALSERFQPERRLGRLKEFTHYFAKNYFFGHHLAAKVQASRSFVAACDRALTFFAEHDADNLHRVVVELDGAPILPADRAPAAAS